MKFKIIEVDETQHSIVVRFWTNKVTENDLAVDVRDGVVLRGRTDYCIQLPVPVPTGNALKAYILKHAPVDFLDIQELVKDPGVDTSMSALRGQIGIEQSGTPDREPVTANVPRSA